MHWDISNVWLTLKYNLKYDIIMNMIYSKYIAKINFYMTEEMKS